MAEYISELSRISENRTMLENCPSLIVQLCPRASELSHGILQPTLASWTVQSGSYPDTCLTSYCEPSGHILAKTILADIVSLKGEDRLSAVLSTSINHDK